MTGVLCQLGCREYHEVYELQIRLVAGRQSGAIDRDHFLVTEHPSVYTLGRRGGREFLMVSDDFLAQRNIPVVPIERGGVITYHGPGQLVIYPILHLKKAHLGVADYVRKLEEVMILLAAKAGVGAMRDHRNHGVWSAGKKLGSVGIAIRRGVSFHGLALNVNPDMAPFGWINPCGLTGVQMTSLAMESGREVEIADLLPLLPAILGEVFGTGFEELSAGQEICFEVRN